MTDYEKAVIANQNRQIQLTQDRLSHAQQMGDKREIYRLQQALNKLYNELREYQELFYISHLETCIDLNGNVLPNKRQILKENEDDESTKPIYNQPD